MLSHQSLLALTKKSDTLDPKSTVAGLGEAHCILLLVNIVHYCLINIILG
jgi:hypothetical protein